MSECAHPKITAENRNADMRTLVGGEYAWFERYLDGRSAERYSGEQRAFIDAYQGIMIGLLDATIRPTTKAEEDNKIRLSHFRDAVRDTVVTQEEMAEMLTMKDFRGIAFEEYLQQMPEQMRKDFALVARSMVNGIADTPEQDGGAKRYNNAETEGIYSAQMRQLLEETNANTMGDFMGDGIEGDLAWMEQSCLPPSAPPRIEACQKAERGVE